MNDQMIIGGIATLLVFVLLLAYGKHKVAVSWFREWFREWLSKFINSYEFEFVLLSPSAKTPTRAYPTDAGYDLYCSQAVVLQPGQAVNIPTGVAVVSKRPIWLFLCGRSSTAIKHKLAVDIGVIDHGYTGELFVKCINIGKEQKIINAGMRIAQIIPIPHVEATLRQVSNFPIVEGGRNSSGFGSSGT